MAVVSAYDEVVRDLGRERDLPKMKKLLYAACRKRWENDAAKIDATSIDELVREVRQLYPSVKQLKDVFDRIVGKLNKKERYTAVASSLLWKLSELYEPAYTEPETRPVKGVEAIDLGPQGADPESFARIAAELDSNPDARRAKKLVYAAQHGRWENNPEQMAALATRDLLKELYDTYPTLDQLSLRLFKVVKTLNKQEPYFAIAKQIIGLLAQLYGESEDSERLELLGEPPSRPDIAAIANQETSFETLDIQLETPPQEERFDHKRFRLRAEVMKYTTPLKAKSLIFTTLHGRELDLQGVDALLLKTYNLDDLLLELVKVYENTSDLEAALESTAKASDRVEDALQAASAVVVSIKAIYQPH